MKFWRRPLDLDEINVPKGKVIIFASRCKGCGFCVEYCPRDVLVLSEDFNKKGYHPPVAINEEGCVNCHFCEIICPEFAIFSIAIEENGDGEGDDS